MFLENKIHQIGIIITKFARRISDNITSMKRIFTIMSTMCLGVALNAQSNIFQTREANSTDGKILTMEETILSRELSPEDLHCRWIDNEHLAIFRNGGWKKYDIVSGKEDAFSSKRTRPNRRKERLATDSILLGK